MRRAAASPSRAPKNDLKPLKLMIRLAIAEEYPTVIEIWERSVRASHHFLSEQDIKSLRELIQGGVLDQLELWVVTSDANVIMAFMGLSANSVEALFVDPPYFRAGLGTILLSHAETLKGELRVDVNEQNPSAVQFYLSHGFEMLGRSEKDGFGHPFPLLHLAKRQHH